MKTSVNMPVQFLSLLKPTQRRLKASMTLLAVLAIAYGSQNLGFANELTQKKEDFLNSVLNRILIHTQTVYEDFDKILNQSSTRADLRQRYFDEFVYDINTKALELHQNVAALIENEDLEDFSLEAKKDMAGSVIDGVFENDLSAEKLFQKILTHHREDRAIDSEFLNKSNRKVPGYSTDLETILKSMAEQRRNQLSPGASGVKDAEGPSYKQPKVKCSACQKKITPVMVSYGCEVCESKFCRNGELQKHFEFSPTCRAEIRKKSQGQIKDKNPVVIADKIKERV